MPVFYVVSGVVLCVLCVAARSTKARLSWYFSTLLCFILALLAKPMAVTLPVILLLMDVYPLNRTHLITWAWRDSISSTRLIVEKIPFFIFTLLSVLLTVSAQHHGNAVATMGEIGIEIRLVNAFNSCIFYISKFIFPVNLSPFYPYPSYRSFHEYYPSLIPVFAFFLITFVCGYLWYKKKYYWLMAWLFYLVTLSPVIGIIQVGSQAAADRYAYLPTIPFYALLGIGIANLLYSAKITKLLRLGIIIGVLLIGVVLIQLTQKQTPIWKNDLTLWTYTAAYAPESGFPSFKLGNVYYLMADYEKALFYYHRAISVDPYHNDWYGILLKTYINLNKFPEALRLIHHVIEHDINIGYSRDNLYYLMGSIYVKQGRRVEAKKALTTALELNPNNHNARNLLLEITSNKSPIPAS